MYGPGGRKSVALNCQLYFLSSRSFPTMTDKVLGQAEYVIFDMDGLLSVSTVHDVDAC